MPAPNPAALDFLLTRRSPPAKILGLPAPSRAELEPILMAGLRVPDHGMLQPWRLVVLEAEGLKRLAKVAGERAAALGLDAEKTERASASSVAACYASPSSNAPAPSRRYRRSNKPIRQAPFASRS